jgi:hypothetical protein
MYSIPLCELSKQSGVSQQGKETINNCSASVALGRHLNRPFPHCVPQDVAHLNSQQSLISTRRMAPRPKGPADGE